ncbi:MAG: molybdopterin molybdenumtransferase MoeA, partial [Pseudomonadota bacterium]
MLSLEEAWNRLLALAPKPPLVETSSASSQSRFLAKNLAAKRTQPSNDLSAMDGYAICGEGPWRKVGESRAGTPFEGSL